MKFYISTHIAGEDTRSSQNATNATNIIFEKEKKNCLSVTIVHQFSCSMA